MSEGNSFVKLGIAAILLVSLAAIVLVGIAIVNGYSEFLRDTTNTSIDDLNVSIVGSPAKVGTSGQYPYLQDLDGCLNASNSSQSFPTTLYNIDPGNVNGGTIELKSTSGAWNNTLVNCSALSYKADSTGQAAADTFSVGLAIFATFSAVLAIALIGLAIIRLFSKK